MELLHLLIDIREYTHEGNSMLGAILARFAAELHTQPKHRLVLTRMAITRNLQVRNYSAAARFLRVFTNRFLLILAAFVTLAIARSPGTRVQASNLSREWLQRSLRARLSMSRVPIECFSNAQDLLRLSVSYSVPTICKY